MNVQFSIPAWRLAVLRLFCASEDIRKELEGIYFEVDKRGSIAIATSGIVLGCWHTLSHREIESADLPLRFNVNASAFSHVKVTAAYLANLPVLICLEEAPAGERLRKVSINWQGNVVAAREQECGLKDWRRVVPTPTGEVAVLNPAILGLAEKVSKLAAQAHKADPRPAAAISPVETPTAAKIRVQEAKRRILTPPVYFYTSGPGKGVLMLIEGEPDFVGVAQALDNPAPAGKAPQWALERTSL